MLLGIISDTHDRVDRTARAVRWLVDAGAEALVHCGDLTGPEVVHECALLPSYYVLGNNDFDESALRSAIVATDGTFLGDGGLITLAERRIAVTHGHLVRVYERLEAEAPDYLFFGHSHVPTDQRQGSTRFINPGALHRAEEWTVALLDLATDNLRWHSLRPAK